MPCHAIVQRNRFRAANQIVANAQSSSGNIMTFLIWKQLKNPRDLFFFVFFDFVSKWLTDTIEVYVDNSFGLFTPKVGRGSYEVV